MITAEEARYWTPISGGVVMVDPKVVAAIRAPLEEERSRAERMALFWENATAAGVVTLEQERVERRAAEERIRELEADYAALSDFCEKHDDEVEAAESFRTENERLREALDVANKALHQNITTWITLSPVLEEPYPDDPRWTPWTRFGKRAADAAVNAQSEIKRALATPPSSTEGTKEVEE